MLQFDVKAFRLEYLKIFEEELYTAKTAWEFEVQAKITSNFYGKYAKVSSEIDRKINHIILHLKANMYALADTYGTGSFMTSNNPGLQDYMNDKDRWNLERHSKAIVGRRSGNYTNLFGQPRHSTGAFAGKNIEGRKVYSKRNDNENDYYISPTRPSFAIPLANQYLKKQWIPIAIKNTNKRMNFGKFLKEVK